MTATTEKFEVRNRWTNRVQFTAEIEVTPDMNLWFKMGLAVKRARKNGADLSGAVLRGADLSGAVLSDAPFKIPNIHTAIYEAASQPGALDMGTWHCGTAHCRAGWAVTLAGDAGKALELAMGTAAAASMIYLASDPKIEKFPNFYCGNDAALEDMKRLAEAEQAAAKVA